MNLKEGKNESTYVVKAIEIEQNLERRLEALGLREGSSILVLNNDKNGALTVKFRGTRFAMGRRIAEHIYVEEVSVNE